MLYEYWCFIKLNSLMKERYKLLSQDIIRVQGSGLYVSLVKGTGSTVKYLDPRNGDVITLSYNPKAVALPTVTQRPDNVLTLEKKGAKKDAKKGERTDDTYDYAYVFDAKYRIDPALPGTEYYDTISHDPGPKVDDINTMHRYRDAIVYDSDAAPMQRTMFGAYVLFPYGNEERYRSHRFYQSIEKVNIGGLPFLPSATTLVSDMLDALVGDSSESAFERATLPKGIEEKLARVDWSRREVLVGTVRDHHQLEVNLEGRFYHTARRNISRDRLPIRYIALYESGVGIRRYGEVISFSLVPRSQIAELPSESDEPYYRFEVSDWKEFSDPVRSKVSGPRVLFYTNLFLLLHAREVP